jgi:histidine triad (HIT) family protein
MEGKSCLFCSWFMQEGSNKLTPPGIIYEDEHIMIVLDNLPISQGHTLLVIKEHVSFLEELNSAQAAYLGKFIPLIAKALKKALSAEFVYIALLGEVVRHVHYHLIPRHKHEESGFNHFCATRKKLVNADELSEKIRKELLEKISEADIDDLVM